MTYEQALEYILCPSDSYKAHDRNTTRLILDKLGNPQDKLRYVHIAGTNGKGSASAFISSILRCAGYKTGLYTSPYIQRFNERIQVNGQQIPDDRLAAIAERVQAADESLAYDGARPSTVFERITAIGFEYFYETQCDVVVLEVGMGGRLDATNVIQCPDAAVIMNIGLDHTEILGDTVEKIAFEKAGIIKEGCQTVLYAQEPCVENVISDVCKSRSSTLHIADYRSANVHSWTLHGTVFDWGKYKNLELSLLGSYQVSNAIVALKTIEVLNEQGYSVSEDAIRMGLKTAHWPGRIELLRKSPFVLVDGAHNPQGTAALVESLRKLVPDRKISFVMGVLADKDYESSIRIVLPIARRFYTVTPQSHRALSSDALADDIRANAHLQVTTCDSIKNALDHALRDASPEDVICVFGSLYQVGEVRSYFGKEEF